MHPDTENGRWILRPAVELWPAAGRRSLLVGHEIVTVRAAGVDVDALLRALTDEGVDQGAVEAGAFGEADTVERLLETMLRSGLVGPRWEPSGEPSDRQVPYYSLFGVDPVAAHGRISRARVAIVGVGGIGGPVAVDLVAAGIGRLVLVDFDVVEVHNLNRQHTYNRADLGTAKVDALRARLLRIRPETSIDTVTCRIGTPDDIDVDGGLDVVVCAADSPPSIGAICTEIAIRHRAAVSFAGIGLGRGFVGPITPYGETVAPPTNADSGPTAFSFGPANQVIASILSGELLRYLATQATPLATSRLIVDTLSWSTAVKNMPLGASR